jgi:hypothetical protein
LTQELREIIDKWDYMKLKSFCTTEGMVFKLKQPPPRMGENLCQLYIGQETGNQNIQGAQKTKSPKINDLMEKWANGLKFFRRCSNG